MSGRYFDARDTTTSSKVIIVDRKLARKFWGDSDPVGRQMFQPGSNEELLALHGAAPEHGQEEAERVGVEERAGDADEVAVR